MRQVMSFRAWIVAMAVLFCFAVSAAADSPYFDMIAKEKKLKIGLNASYPPFALWQGEKAMGFDVEVAGALAEALGLDAKKDIVFIPVKPDDAAEMLAKGEIDVAVAALSLTPGRLRKAAFAGPYVTVSKAALVQRSRIPRVIIDELLRPMPVSNYYDLKKLGALTIGAKQGTTTIRNAAKDFPQSRVKGFANTDELLKAFLDQKIDAVVHEDPFVRYVVAANKSRSRNFLALDDPISKNGLYIAFRFGDPTFARFMDGFIAYLNETGKIEAWKKKYFDSVTWMEGK